MKVNINFIDTFRAKLQTYRLEQRYARRDKRTTTYSNAQYRDGEYFYQDTPSSPSACHPPSPVTTPSSFYSSTSAAAKRLSATYAALTRTDDTSRHRQPSPEFTQATAPLPEITTPGAEARIRARMSMPTVKAEDVFAYYRAENVERRASRAY